MFALGLAGAVEAARALLRALGFHLGVLMRALFGQGTPKEAAEANNAFIFIMPTEDAFLFTIFAVCDAEIAAFVLIAAPMPST